MVLHEVTLGLLLYLGLFVADFLDGSELFIKLILHTVRLFYSVNTIFDCPVTHLFIHQVISKIL